MKHLFLFLICQLSFAFTAWGNPAEIPPAVMFKQLSTTEGLSNNSVRSIFRDSRGFLWIGTESGLNKYDGYSFRQYHRDNSELPDDAIINIFEGHPTVTVSTTTRPESSTMTTKPHSKN